MGGDSAPPNANLMRDWLPAAGAGSHPFPCQRSARGATHKPVIAQQNVGGDWCRVVGNHRGSVACSSVAGSGSNAFSKSSNACAAFVTVLTPAFTTFVPFATCSIVLFTVEFTVEFTVATGSAGVAALSVWGAAVSSVVPSPGSCSAVVACSSAPSLASVPWLTVGGSSACEVCAGCSIAGVSVAGGVPPLHCAADCWVAAARSNAKLERSRSVERGLIGISPFC